MSTTYLALTNRAIQEAGQALASLTSSNFASTTDSMQIKFKSWVSQAWADIQTDRRGWHFMKKKGIYILQPRIEFYDGYASVSTVFDNQTIADTNDNWAATVNTTLYLESGAWASGTAKGWFNITDENGLLPIVDQIKTTDLVQFPVVSAITFNTFSQDTDSFATAFASGGVFYGDEAAYGVVVGNSTAGSDYIVTVAFYTQALYDAFIAYVALEPLSTFQTVGVAATDQSRVVGYLSDVNAGAASFRVTGWGRYLLDTTGDDTAADSGISDIQEVDANTFRISPYSGSTTSDYSVDRQFLAVQHLTPESWNARGYSINKPLGQPCYYTIDYDGKYSFYPQPDKAYVVTFNYWKTPQVLSVYSDTVEGIPDYYTDVIVWKACCYWAEYDESGSQRARMQRRFMSIYNKLLRDYCDSVKFPQGVGEASFG